MTQFTLVYWKDDHWLVGQLKEMPNVFTQGETLDELKENIRDCYELIREDELLNVPKESAELTISL
jgi:predicted RNase H-like HicB family nuclease